MKTLIDFIYTLLIGAAVALFVGLGIWTFYSGPKMPNYPDYNGPYTSAPTDAQNKEMEQRQEKYNKEFKQYEKENKTYSKKVAAIALAAGVVFYAAGIWLMKREDVVGEGVALGGIFSAVYAAGRAAVGDFKQLVFGSVTVLLAMLIVLALYRLRVRRPQTAKARTGKR
jgi:nitrogen fixation-related uncharacterized protein